MAHLSRYSNQIGLQEDPSSCRENLMTALANCQSWEQSFDTFKETVELGQTSKTIKYSCECNLCNKRCPAGDLRGIPCEPSGS